MTLTATDLRAEAKAHFEAASSMLESYGLHAAGPSASLHCNRALTLMSLYKDARVVELPDAEARLASGGLRRSPADSALAAVRLVGPRQGLPRRAWPARLGRLARRSIRARLLMLQMAVETLLQASELVAMKGDQKVIEATEEMEGCGTRPRRHRNPKRAPTPSRPSSPQP